MVVGEEEFDAAGLPAPDLYTVSYNRNSNTKKPRHF